MFVRMTFTKSDPACAEAARALYNSEEVSGVLERQRGHRFHHLLESVDVPGEGVSVTTSWDSREDAEAYERSGAYEELVAKFIHFYTSRRGSGPTRCESELAAHVGCSA